MKPRLVHSRAGYHRLLQMSSASLLVLVEGNADVYFYSRVIDAAGFPFDYEVRPARDLPGSTGGKLKLLGYYKYLRRRRLLCSCLGGKTTAIVFMVDKDVDDVLRKKRRSNHVVYTQQYELENYLYAYGDVIHSAGAVAQVSASVIGRTFPADWRVVAAVTWREWIHLCLVARAVDAKVQSNFSVPSQLNSPCDGGSDVSEYASRLDAIRLAAGWDSSTFQRLSTRLDRLITSRFSAGLHGTLFRGKWFAIFLRQWSIGVSRRSWSEQELSAVLAASMKYDGEWSTHLRDAFREAAIQCGLKSSN